MSAAASSSTFSDSWMAWAAMIGLAPVTSEPSSDDRALPLFAVAAMILGTFLLGFVRRRLEGVLEAWRRDAQVAPAETLSAPASPRGD